MANNLEIKRFLNQCSILLSKQDIDNCIDNPEIANRAKLQNETEEMYIQKNIQYVNIKKFVMLNIYRQIKAAEMLKLVSNKLYKEALENIEKMKDFLINKKGRRIYISICRIRRRTKIQINNFIIKRTYRRKRNKRR